MNLPPNTAHKRRGQPVVVLSGVLACWTGVRVLAWTFSAATPVTAVPQQHVATVVKPAQAPAQMLTSGGLARGRAAPMPTPVAPVFTPAMPSPTPLAPSATVPTVTAAPQPSVTPAPAPPATQRFTPAMAGGHQLMFLAALSMVPMPPEFMPGSAKSPRPKVLAPRWSADGWLLLRRDAGVASLASSGGSYGASQIGAVLRYRLDRSSANKPSLYLRASGALNGMREQEAAFGLSLRPLGRVPVLAMAEGRVSRSATGTHLRPAAFLVTELPPAKLPLGLRGEAYAQAGYVGGKGASAFVDGQARIDGKLFSIGKAEMRAGGALWGGAQEGASRLDLGPSASLSFRLADTASARLSADWRFRVAGRAAPASGPALTLSAGF